MRRFGHKEPKSFALVVSHDLKALVALTAKIPGFIHILPSKGEMFKNILGEIKIATIHS
ncbi:MAG: hypothetical protein ACFFD4_04340 [Candidatus Odinarchaeota archaeon]